MSANTPKKRPNDYPAVTGGGHSRPIQRIPVQLYSHHAILVFKRAFSRFCKSTHVVCYIAYTMGKDKEAEVAEAAIRRKLDAVQYSLDASFKDSSDKLKEANGTDELCDYSAPESFVAEVNAPLSRRYLNLIIGMDKMIRAYDSMMMSELISMASRNHETYEWQRTLFGLGSDMHHLSEKMMGLAGTTVEGIELQENRAATPKEFLEDESGDIEVQPAQSKTGSANLRVAGAGGGV